MYRVRMTLAAGLLPYILSLPVYAAPPGDLPLLPRPKSLALAGGDLSLTKTSRIVAVDETLRPLAAILAGDIERIHGLALAADPGKTGKDGDIVLRPVKDDPEVKGLDAYRIVADRSVIIKGENHGAVVPSP